METEDLVMLCICDYSEQLRGKDFPASELCARHKFGTCFGAWFATTSVKRFASFDEYGLGLKMPWVVRRI